MAWTRMPVDTARLALIIPTYRWNDLARDVLTQAAAIGGDDIRVHIGDNSANGDKHAFLAELAARSRNVVVTCHPRNLGADPNWLHLVKAQTAPYICMAADDDFFGAPYFRAALALLAGEPGCASAGGLYFSIAHSPKTGAKNRAPVLRTPVERRETDPLERIRRYNGENTICYAVSKRTVVRGFAGFVEQNPLPCPFYDYMLAFHLLSTGTYRLDRAGFAYAYDHSNWQLNDSFITSNKRWYEGYGLPDAFGYLTRLHWAVVAVHFFSSSFRSPDLPAAGAAAIAAYLFDRQRREFARDFYRYRSAVEALFAGHDEAAAAVRRLMTRTYAETAAIFDDFALVVGLFAPDVARRHRAFQAETLLPGTDAISLSGLASFKSLSLTRARAGNVLHRTLG